VGCGRAGRKPRRGDCRLRPIHGRPEESTHASWTVAQWGEASPAGDLDTVKPGWCITTSAIVCAPCCKPAGGGKTKRLGRPCALTPRCVGRDPSRAERGGGLAVSSPHHYDYLYAGIRLIPLGARDLPSSSDTRWKHLLQDPLSATILEIVPWFKFQGSPQASKSRKPRIRSIIERPAMEPAAPVAPFLLRPPLMRRLFSGWEAWISRFARTGCRFATACRNPGQLVSAPARRPPQGAVNQLWQEHLFFRSLRRPTQANPALLGKWNCRHQATWRMCIASLAYSRRPGS